MNPAAPSKEEVFRLCGLAQRELGKDLVAGTRLAVRAYQMAREINDGLAIAEALRMKAHFEYSSARYRRACRTYERAIRILEDLGDHSTAARTRSSAVQSLIYLGRYEEALDWAATARRTFEQQTDLLRLARLDANIGNILHRQDRHAEAVDAYTRALTALREQGDESSAAIALRNMAVAMIGTMQLDRALSCFQQAREIFSRLNLPVLENEVDINVAYLNFLEGNYTRAIHLYRVSTSRKAENPHKAAISLLDQSDLFLELNLFQEAAHLAAEAMDGFARLRMRSEKARSLLNLGIAHLHLGNVGISLKAFGRVRKLFLRDQNKVWVAITDLSRALAMEGAGRSKAAVALATRARVELGASAFTGKALLALIVCARLHLRQGEPQAARALAHQANAGLGSASAPHLQLSAEMIIAESAAALGDSQAAFDSFQRAHTLADSLRQRLVRDELQLSFLQDKRAIYEGLVAILVERADFAGAFRFVEYGKSRSLADSLTRPDGLIATEPGQTKELHLQLRRLYRRLDTLESRPEPLLASSLDRLRRQALECEQALSLARAGAPARVADPIDVAASALAQTQAALGPGEAFLQYFRIRDTLLLFVATRNKIESFPLGRASELQDVWHLLRFQLSRGALPWANSAERTWLPATRSHLERIYRLLIAPAEPLLPAGHWTIAPHEDLHRIPFHALLSQGRYLIDQRTVSYAPSASVWLACLAKSFNSSVERYSVFAVPDPRCPSIALEAESVARALPGAELFLGRDASLEHLRRCRGSRFIHIASHGVFRADNPAFSSLRLGDGRLCLFDLRDLTLDTELITLSGCATGVQESAGADEILGLTRGVLLAGARSAQVTLWAINDESTTAYMQAFYSAVRAGADPAVALQSAMIELRSRYPHPYYWAPFILTGAPVREKKMAQVYQTSDQTALST